MEIVPILGAFVSFAAMVGILYPFKPFGKRRNALFTLIGCIVVIGATAPEVDRPAPEQAAAAAPAPTVARQTPAPAVAGTNDRDAARAARRAAETATKAAAARQAQEDAIRQTASTLRWSEALAQFGSLSADGMAREEFIAEIEALMLGLVRPLPASEAEANIEGYQLLAALRPEDAGYAEKVADYAARIEQARGQAISALRTEVDKVEGITWYQHPNRPRYTNSRSTVYLYIGRRGDAGQPWLRMQVQYASRDWLFVSSVTAWHDGVKEPLIAGRFERDHNATIWEWLDVAPSDRQLAVLRSLSGADEAILRFEGDQYRRDVTLSAADKQALRDVMLAYEAMRGGS